MTLPAIIASVLLVGCAAVGAALVVIDIRQHRLPNVLVLPLYPAALVVAVLVSIDDGSPGPLTSAVAAAIVLFVGYYLLHRFGGGMGGGDVKLAGALGLLTGAYGWQVPFAATVLAFLLGGLVALLLVITRRAHRRTRIAFGPFMLTGAAAALAWHLARG